MITEKFRIVLTESGLPFNGLILADGHLHRFKAEGDKKKDSWYVLHSGPPAAGAFGCWRRDLKETWCERNGNLSQGEWAKVRKSWQDAERQRSVTEEELHAAARATASKAVSESFCAKPTHPYLVRKRVKPHGDLRQSGDLLILPLRDQTGDLHSLQYIAPDKRFGDEGETRDKSYLRHGRIAGCYFTIAEIPDKPLVIVEGYATGASVYEGTGYAVVCAMHCGNLLAVALSIRKQHPEREIFIAADNDQFAGKNPGLTKATEAAKAIKAKLAVPAFSNTSSKPTDFNDLAALEGVNVVRLQIANANLVLESDSDAFQRLAQLSPAEYDRRREAEAKRLGIRVATLDQEVFRNQAPKEGQIGSAGQFEFPTIDPWPHAVIGEDLLDQIYSESQRFVVADSPALVASTLFVVHTYALEFTDISPILFITSPTRRCGKSILLSLMSKLTYRALVVGSVSPAGLYRVIDEYHPTLHLDEVDTFLKGNEQLRGLLNCGHTRDAAYHLGCNIVGEKILPWRWSMWAPKICSGIGRLASTIEDRSIIINMRRRRADEPRHRLRYRTRFIDIPRQCIRFVSDNAEILRGFMVKDDELEVNDRALDNWEPLLAVAEAAGGKWPRMARDAALSLSGRDRNNGVGEQLLADIRFLLADSGRDRLSSEELCRQLAGMEDRAWAEHGNTGKPISPHQLAGLLRGFRVAPHNIRVGDKTPKGYQLADFEDAFSRYLPKDGKENRHTATTSGKPGSNAASRTATETGCGGSEISGSTNEIGACGVVADGKSEIADEEAL